MDIYKYIYIFMGISIVMGVPPNLWMVFVRENATKMDDDWGYPISGNLHMPIYIYGYVLVQNGGLMLVNLVLLQNRLRGLV